MSSQIKGVKIGVGVTNAHYRERDDLAVFELTAGATTAATFTQNRFVAAPVMLAKKHLSQADTRYLLINAGNANAGTGERGLKDALLCCESLAQQVNCPTESVLPFSTGVVGEYLPVDKIQNGVRDAVAGLSEDNWQAAACAIMTTDTKEKLLTHEFTLNGENCRITGIAKGAGMVHPNMATMLAFIATDAGITRPLLQQALSQAVADSFNCVTIDGDTSPNDACVVAATHQSNVVISDDMTLQVFTAKLALTCKKLAEMLILDAEGATKLARIKVSGGRNREECKTVGYTVALSPLVKTALFGQDANWGRILAAVGRAPIADLELSAVDIFLDDICVVRHGERDAWYAEADGARIMQRDEVTIHINMRRGEAEAEILTSDLSRDYVSINADYRS